MKRTLLFPSLLLHSLILLILASVVSLRAEVRDFSATYSGTLTSSYSIYVPPASETPRIKGVVFLYPGSSGDWRFRVKDPIWQDAVRSLGFALIGADNYGYTAIGSSASAAAFTLNNILTVAASVTGHAELVNVPIISMGTSLGGFSSTKWAYYLPSRTIAIAAQRGANSFSNNASGEQLNVHTLVIPGSIDSNGITNPPSLRNYYNYWRNATVDGRAAWCLDWMAEHDTFGSNQTWALSWSWAAESIALRYPANTIPSVTAGNPIVLNNIPLSNGWLGQQSFATSSTGADRSSFCTIAPYSQYAGDKGIASWLPNETLARVYQACNSFDGVKTRTVIPLQGPLAIVGDAAPLASVPSQTDIPQMATWPVGSTITITVDPREFDDVRSIVTMEYYDGSTLLATQVAPGTNGWILPYTLQTVGIHSLIVIATDSLGNKTSAFRTVVSAPVRNTTTAHWRFEANPYLTTDINDNLTLSESSDTTKRPIRVDKPASGPGANFPGIDLPYGDNNSAMKFDVTKSQYITGLDNAFFSKGTNGAFTFEAVVNLSTTDAGGSARAIAAHGGYNSTDMGWILMVTAETSGRGARNLLFAYTDDGKSSTADTIDSDLQLVLGVDYYIAVVFNPADTSANGLTFYLKDLTNKGPLVKVQRTHTKTALWNSAQNFTLGSGNYNTYWDGLIDEVRFSTRLLTQSELMINKALVLPPTFTLWLQSTGLASDAPATGDHNHNGVPNLLEYALALPPDSATLDARQTHGTTDLSGSTYLTYTYTRPEPAPTDLTYIVEASTNLSDWTTAGLVETSNTVTNNLRTITLRDTTATSAATQRFLRLRVVRP